MIAQHPVMYVLDVITTRQVGLRIHQDCARAGRMCVRVAGTRVWITTQQQRTPAWDSHGAAHVCATLFPPLLLLLAPTTYYYSRYLLRSHASLASATCPHSPRPLSILDRSFLRSAPTTSVRYGSNGPPGRAGLARFCNCHVIFFLDLFREVFGWFQVFFKRIVTLWL